MPKRPSLAQLAFLAALLAPTSLLAASGPTWTLPDGGLFGPTGGAVPALRHGQISSAVIKVVSPTLPSVKRSVAGPPTFKAAVAIGRTKYPITMIGSNPFVKGCQAGHGNRRDHPNRASILRWDHS
jgi:hypothetical protein